MYNKVFCGLHYFNFMHKKVISSLSYIIVYTVCMCLFGLVYKSTKIYVLFYAIKVRVFKIHTFDLDLKITIIDLKC